MIPNNRGVLVTGGGSFLGDHIARALLAEGAEVSLLVRAGAESQLGSLAHQTRWSTADVWDPSSLRGKARAQTAVIHTVGSLHADPARGLSYERLNFVSARNVGNMCASDGVQHLLLISAVRAPWTTRGYIRSKRAAERYLRRLGMRHSVIRAPLLYQRGQERHILYRASSLLAKIPPLSWLPFGRIGPMPIDIFARAVARIALSPNSRKTIYFPRDLRRLNTREELRQGNLQRTSAAVVFSPAPPPTAQTPGTASEDLPFAWAPEDET